MPCRSRLPVGTRPHAFLHALFAMVALYPLSIDAAGPVDVRIGFLGETGTDAWFGASQGITEANVQGRFLGLHYELTAFSDPADALALEIATIVADVSAARLTRLAELALEVPVLNVSAEDEELREACYPNLFHTIPSLAMRDDAVRQWQRQSPGSLVVAQAWHPEFVKYAAAQLNKRYKESAARPMSDVAWAAWAAVKLTTDTVARLGHGERAGILDAFQDDLAFDGQKGIPMSFRDTGQLRQPLLLVDGGRIVGEAPVRGVVGAGNLDTLGLAECPK